MKKGHGGGLGTRGRQGAGNGVFDLDVDYMGMSPL